MIELDKLDALAFLWKHAIPELSVIAAELRKHDWDGKDLYDAYCRIAELEAELREGEK